MSPMTRDEIFEDEHFCNHCLTELDRWAARCFRCDASFHGTHRHHLVSGRPDMTTE